MQFRLLFHTLSILTMILGVSMLLPLTVGLIYKEKDVLSFLISLVLTLSFGVILFFLTRHNYIQEVNFCEEHFDDFFDFFHCF